MLAVFLMQLHDNLRSARFQASLSLLLLFFVANGVIYAMKMERMNEQFARVMTFDNERYERAETVATAADNWLIIRSPDLGIEYMAEAGSFWFMYGRWVNAASGTNMWERSSRTTNAWMRHFEVLDWSVIVRYVLSFLCIVLAFNAISGEREEGPLRLALANPLPRASFLLGKFLGHWVTLAIGLLAGTIISLAILSLQGVLQLDGRAIGGYGLFLLSALMFAALFLLLSIGVSALARTSATALVFLLTLWTVLIVVIPQTSYLIAKLSSEPIGPHSQAIGARSRQTHEALRHEGIRPRPMELARQDGYSLEHQFIARVNEMDADLARMQRGVHEMQVRQYQQARSVNLLSPGFAFQYAVEAFLGTGIHRYEHFVTQAWRYREYLRDFLRARDAADPDSPHVLFLRNFMSTKPLDARDVPRFSEQRIPWPDAMQAALPSFTILLAETLGALFFALWAFHRADLSG